MVDYYAILGVRPKASYQELFKAYRQLAAKHHPDRGGSHEAMVRVNEAWYILSDAERRRVYDQARAAHATESQVQQFRKDMHEARTRAAVYPGTWELFSKWLGRLQADIHSAQYSRSGDDPFFNPPTIEGSVSGGVAMILGVTGVLGWVLITSLLDPLFTEGLWTLFNNPHGKPLLLFIIFPGAAGLWLGYWFHLGLRMLLPALGHLSTYRRSDSVSGKRVVRCHKCQQSLGVPNTDKTLAVRCPACGYRFEIRGNQGQRRTPGKLDPIRAIRGFLLVLGTGVLCAGGISLGVYKATVVGFHHKVSEESLAEARGALIGTWDGTANLSASEVAELFGEADDGFMGGITITGTTTYESSGVYASQSELIIYGVGDEGAGHLSFSIQENGRWSVVTESGRRMLHYDVADVTLTPTNDTARLLARVEPQSFREMQSEMCNSAPVEIVELNQDELRTRDPDKGLEMTERRRPSP